MVECCERGLLYRRSTLTQNTRIFCTTGPGPLARALRSLGLAPVDPGLARVVPWRAPLDLGLAPVDLGRVPVDPELAQVVPGRAPVGPALAPVIPWQAPVVPGRAPVDGAAPNALSFSSTKTQCH